jgi:glucose/arabinose dehydrogenase
MALAACNGTATVEPADASVPIADRGLVLEPLNTELDKPWGMDFLSEGEVLVTQQGGKLLRFDLAGGETVEISAVPESAEHGQGGLLDVLVEQTDRGSMVYLSYTHATDDGYTTRVSRGLLQGDALVDVQVLFTALPYYDTKYHFGSRLLIVDDYLFLTVGDRGKRDYAQDLSRHNGSVMRIHRDGRVPADNPFVDTPGAKPEIWTYGHRNPQGLARHPDGSIWVSEHGPKGGDELNQLEPGNNYGWPIITYGEEYRGGKIGEGTEKPGMEQPEKYYLPSIATCGMDFYSGDTYPGWSDSVLVTALALTHLNRVELDGAGLGDEFRHFDDSQLRFRDVQVGPDGYVYVLAGNGIYRVTPGGSGD